MKHYLIDTGTHFLIIKNLIGDKTFCKLAQYGLCVVVRQHIACHSNNVCVWFELSKVVDCLTSQL